MERRSLFVFNAACSFILSTLYVNSRSVLKVLTNFVPEFGFHWARRDFARSRVFILKSFIFFFLVGHVASGVAPSVAQAEAPSKTVLAAMSDFCAEPGSQDMLLHIGPGKLSCADLELYITVLKVRPHEAALLLRSVR